MRISDWSSDVCSSDLTALLNKLKQENISGSRLHKLHARIQHGIQQIDHQIDDHEQQSHQHHVGDDNGAVELVDAVYQQLAHARPGTYSFGNGRVGDQGAELHADDDRKSGVVGQRVEVREGSGGRWLLKKKKK